jgi:hypothetical protein
MGSDKSSKPQVQKYGPYHPMLVQIPVFMFVLLAALTMSVPLGLDGASSGLVFWANLVPQLMSLTRSTNEPDHLKSALAFNITKGAHLSPLTNILSVDDPDWQKTLLERISDAPVVVRGMIQGESKHFGNVSTLEYSQLRSQVFQDDHVVSAFTHMTKDKSAHQMPFSEYDDRMRSGEKLYARAVPDPGYFTENMDLYWLAGLIGKKWSLWLTLLTASGGSTGGNLPLTFIGSHHVSSQAHCDIGTSIFVMIQGRKRWQFFPPSETALMYPYGQQSNVAYNAGVNVFKPNAEKYPEFTRAKGFEVVIEPGDVLFFPSMWWHAVQNLDEITIGTDVPMIDILGSWRRNSLFTICTLFNPKLLVNYAFAAWNGLSLREMYFQGYLVDQKKK